MYFTEEEIKQIPSHIRDKAKRINKSHYLSAYNTILKQKESWEREMQENPFTIRSQVMNTEEGVVESNRQDSETALKIIKLLPELAESLNNLYDKLTSEEKAKVEYASDAKEVQKSVLEKVNELQSKGRRGRK